MVSPAVMDPQLMLLGLFQAVAQEFPLPEDDTEPLTYQLAACRAVVLTNNPKQSIHLIELREKSPSTGWFNNKPPLHKKTRTCESLVNTFVILIYSIYNLVMAQVSLAVRLQK
jgi:hypothetical protein